MDPGATPAAPSVRFPESLDDGTVFLDRHRLEDAEAHLEGEDEEMRRRFDATGPATLEQTRAAMLRWMEARKTGGPMFAYAVRLSSGRLIGGCELRMQGPASARVSYWIFREFRRRGYALRTLSLLSQAANMVAALERLEAPVAADNLASRRLLGKAGFIETGTVEETASTGKVSSLLLYVRALGGASAI